jgi:hypothetical protein
MTDLFNPLKIKEILAKGAKDCEKTNPTEQDTAATDKNSQ